MTTIRMNIDPEDKKRVHAEIEEVAEHVKRLMHTVDEALSKLSKLRRWHLELVVPGHE